MLDNAEMLSPDNSFGWQYYNDLAILFIESDHSELEKKEMVFSYYNKSLDICGDDINAKMKIKSGIAAALIILNNDIEKAQDLLNELKPDLDKITKESRAEYNYAESRINDARKETQKPVASS